MNCKTLWLACLVFFTPQAMAMAAVQEAYLPNGLRVLLMESHNVPLLAMRLIVPAGSYLDAPEKAGTAEMMASMMSDHTGKHDHQAWAALLDDDAIQLGASASRDHVSVSLTVLSELAPQGVHALAELLLYPGSNQKRFTQLKEDAQAGLAKAEERPGVRASRVAAALLYGKHAFGHSVSGTVESLARIQLSDVQSMYRQQVKPQGSVLAVSGDISMRELLAVLKPALKTWHGKAAHYSHELPYPVTQAVKHVHINMPTHQALLELLRLGPARSDADFFASFVLNHILGGGGFASKLMTEVREKRGLVYGVYSYFVPLDVPGPFVIRLQTKASQAAEAEQVVRAVMTNLYQGKISAADVAAAKANLMGSFAQRSDSNRERVALLALLAQYHLPLDYLQNWTASIKAVSLSDVQKAAKHWLNPEQWSSILVAPKS